jgi:hypothetical protein
MVHFTRFLQDAFQALTTLPHETLELPAQYATITYDEPQGQTVMRNHFIRLGEWGEIRSACIDSPKVNIMNTFFFPQPDWDLPLLTMELVIFSTRPVVGVIDLLSALPELPCHQRAQAILQQAHIDFPHLQQAPDLPAWYQACCSQFNFFIRPQTEAEVSDFQLAYRQIWHNFLTLVPNAPSLPLTQVPVYQQKLVAYKQHHRDNMPGLKFMHHYFGEAWTAEYLSRYLFV